MQTQTSRILVIIGLTAISLVLLLPIVALAQE
ncbi:MAG: hypothetical protein ACI9EW_003816, partial [Cellvibrionaceae bacterium]